MDVSAVITKTTQALQEAGIENAEAEAQELVSECLSLSRSELALSAQKSLEADEQEKLETWILRRSQREALQHISGYANFYGLRLRVNNSVLIPRPETEVMVEQALSYLQAALKDVQEPLVIDIGTGSGAIALAIKTELPAARVLASDISISALEVAEQNAKALNLDIEFYHSNLLDNLMDHAQEADLLISNPPYLPLNDTGTLSPEVDADPALALYAGEDGLEVFKRLEQQSYDLLKPAAIMLVELDPRNIKSAYDLCERWQGRGIFEDLLGRKRFLQLLR